jgi:hypothetical protein
MQDWQNPILTLGERCIAFAKSEMQNQVKEDRPGSYTSPRIREYFSICTRDIDGIEVPVNISKGNWCAASASFCLKNALRMGENAPHKFRVGVVEIVKDLQSNKSWVPTKSVINKAYRLRIGDLIIFDRSQANKPETAWWRHIGRVFDISDSSFQCISGNSNGCWKISTHQLFQKNLLGFGKYPSINETAKMCKNIDWSDINIDLAHLAPSIDTGNDLQSDNFCALIDKK